MAAFKISSMGLLKNSRFRWGTLASVWVAVVVLVVVPVWRGVLQRNNEISDLETRLGTMDDWTVAGMWLAPSVKERTLPVNAAFSRLFPPERFREDLFLSLARVADQSLVENFTLCEAKGLGMENNDVWSDGTDMAAGDTPPPPDGSAPGMDNVPEMNIPKVELISYRVKAEFNGDYQRIADFMNGLKRIERATKVHSLVVRPQRESIKVKLELDVYVSKTSQS